MIILLEKYGLRRGLKVYSPKQWSSRWAPVYTSVHRNYFTVHRNFSDVKLYLLENVYFVFFFGNQQVLT